MNPVDKILNKVTMYRLVLYGLLVIVATAIIEGIYNILGYSFSALMGSLITLCATGYAWHFVLGRAFK